MLKAKHAGKLMDKPPPSIDGSSWRIFTEYVREGRPLKDITRETGLCASKIGLILNIVDQALEPPHSGNTRPNLALESSIDDLFLSTRSLNALRELQCDNVESVLRKDFARVTTRFRLGRVTRWEIATALARGGFEPPPSLLPMDPRAESVAAELRKLRHRLDDDHRFWKQQLRSLEERVRRLSKTELKPFHNSVEAR
jgi:hypothetical protein